MLKYRNVRFVSDSDWDDLVQETYNRPYIFQQQDGCRDRGTFTLEVPSMESDDDDMNESIDHDCNKISGCEEYGVKFKTWLAETSKRYISLVDRILNYFSSDSKG